MSWLDGWNYRRGIIIDNTGNSNALTDYQVKVVLDSSNFDFSKANSDGSDIRFTDNDGTTLLNYWIENWDSSNQTATIWTKVPLIPASFSYTVYMYYGNSSATSESNIQSTSIANQGDDFNEANLDTNRWIIKKMGSNNAVVELDGSGHLHLAGEPSTISSGNLLSTATFTNGFSIRAKRKYSDEHYADISIGNGVLQDMDNGGQSGWWHTTQGNGYIWAQQRLDNHFFAKTPSGTAFDEFALNTNSFGAVNTYEIIDFIYDTSGNIKWIHNGIEKLSATDTDYLNSDKYILLSQGEYTDNAGGDSYYDWIFIHKYTSPEPTTSVGSEEINPVSGFILSPF